MNSKFGTEYKAHAVLRRAISEAHQRGVSLQQVLMESDQGRKLMASLGPA